MYISPNFIGHGTHTAITEMYEYTEYENIINKDWAQPTDRKKGINILGWSPPVNQNRTPTKDLDLEI